jgi:nicotinate-nucleotide adenylyltransferase
MKMGILGGTFDPPHNGHLHLAESARRVLKLDEVVFIPAKQPPHKLDDPISPLPIRVAMLECALHGHPKFVISMIEAEREGPSYTVDTLRELRKTAGKDAELYFIMGEDSLKNLPTWHLPEEIVKLAHLAVLQRPGYDANVEALEQKVKGVEKSVVLLDGFEIEISSTDIRERVRCHESIAELVPDCVAEYIEQHHLYVTP